MKAPSCYNDDVKDIRADLEYYTEQVANFEAIADDLFEQGTAGNLAISPTKAREKYKRAMAVVGKYKEVILVLDAMLRETSKIIPIIQEADELQNAYYRKN